MTADSSRLTEEIEGQKTSKPESDACGLHVMELFQPKYMYDKKKSGLWYTNKFHAFNRQHL